MCECAQDEAIVSVGVDIDGREARYSAEFSRYYYQHDSAEQMEGV